jgi:hypothetical protein
LAGLGTGSLGQVGRSVSGPALRAANRRQPVLPFQISRRDAQKECVPITCVLETRKGVPTNRAGTPDRLHLERSAAFAKGFFAKILAKMPRQSLS